MPESTLEVARRIHDRAKKAVVNWGTIRQTERAGATIEDYLERTSIPLGIYRRCDLHAGGPEYIEVLGVTWAGPRLTPEVVRVKWCEFGEPRKRKLPTMPLFGKDGFLYPVFRRKGYRGPRFQRVTIDAALS